MLGTVCGDNSTASGETFSYTATLAALVPAYLAERNFILAQQSAARIKDYGKAHAFRSVAEASGQDGRCGGRGEPPRAGASECREDLQR